MLDTTSVSGPLSVRIMVRFGATLAANLVRAAVVPGLGAVGLAIKMVVLQVVGVNIQAYVVAHRNGWGFDYWYQGLVLMPLLCLGLASIMGNRGGSEHCSSGHQYGAGDAGGRRGVRGPLADPLVPNAGTGGADTGGGQVGGEWDFASVAANTCVVTVRTIRPKSGMVEQWLLP